MRKKLSRVDVTPPEQIPKGMAIPVRQKPYLVIPNLEFKTRAAHRIVTQRIVGLTADIDGIETVVVNGKNLSLKKADQQYRHMLNIPKAELKQFDIEIDDDYHGRLTIVATDIRKNKVSQTLQVKAGQVVRKIEKNEKTGRDILLKHGTYWALLIANKDYQNGLDSLRTPFNDVKTLKKILIDQYRFQSDHIEIVQNATLKDMKVKLDKMHDQVKDNDSLLIYYAGHGYQDNSFGGKGYWMPVDALPAWSEASPRTTWFANSIVHQAIEVSRAKHILLISDSCYAGTLKYRSTQQRQPYAMSESFIFSLAGKKSRRAITSGDLEPVLDSDGEGGNLSLFARHLTETLSNAEGPLNAQRLFDIVRGKVYKRQGQHPQYFTIPQVGDEEGDFVFLLQGCCQ